MINARSFSHVGNKKIVYMSENMPNLSANPIVSRFIYGNIKQIQLTATISFGILINSFTGLGRLESDTS